MPRVRKCCILHCSRSASNEVSLFSLPKDPTRCQEWLTLCQREDLKSKSSSFIANNIKICSLHFEEKDFLHVGPFSRKLKEIAKPAISERTLVQNSEERINTPRAKITFSPFQRPSSLSPASPHILRSRTKMCYLRERRRIGKSPVRTALFSKMPSEDLAHPGHVAAPLHRDEFTLKETLTTDPSILLLDSNIGDEQISSSALSYSDHCMTVPAIINSSAASNTSESLSANNIIPSQVDSKISGNPVVDPSSASDNPSASMSPICSSLSRSSLNTSGTMDSGSDNPLNALRSASSLPSQSGTIDSGTPSASDSPLNSLLSASSLPSQSTFNTADKISSTPRSTRNCTSRKTRSTPKARLSRTLEKKDYQKLVKSLKVKLKRAERRKCNPKLLNVKAASEVAEWHMSKVAKLIFDAQLLMYNTPKNGRKWSVDLKNVALSVYFHSPKTYRFLRRFFVLPCISTLKRHLNQIKLNPGINEKLVAFLKDTVSNWEDKDKVCTVILDEISIQEGLRYNPAADVITGFVDDGENRENILANEVLCVMVKGITKPWKQLLGYWLTHDEGGHEIILKAIQDSINALEAAGLTVKLVISDQGPKNRAAVTRLGINTERPYFFHNGNKIFSMWDTPHLLKSMRHNLQKYNFMYKGQLIKWRFIRSAFHCSHPVRLKLMPKIIERHINVNNFKKMKVKLARQIFSESVSACMEVLIALRKLPPEAEPTHLFLLDFDRLFDTFNSMQLNTDKLKFRFAITESSRHIKFLKKMEIFLKNSKFIIPDKEAKSFCLDGWILNIRCLLMLVKDLREKHNILKVRTRLLNQDALENCFSTVRQQHGCSDNPTVAQIESGFRILMLTSVPKLSKGSNCEDDSERYLVSVQHLASETDKNSKNLPANTVLTTDADTDENEDALFEELFEDGIQMDDVEQNALYYVTGYLGHQFLKTHADCKVCQEKLNVPKEKQHFTNTYQLLGYTKAYSKELGGLYGNLCIPSDDIYEDLMLFEEVFNRIFEKYAHLKNLSSRFLSIFLPNLKFKLCSNEMSLKFFKMVLRTRIYWAVKFKVRNNSNAKAAARNTKKKLKKINHGKIVLQQIERRI